MGATCQVCSQALEDIKDNWVFCPYCGVNLEASNTRPMDFQVRQNVGVVEEGASFVGVKIGRLG